MTRAITLTTPSQWDAGPSPTPDPPQERDHMPKPKPAHHRGTYHATAAKVRAAANADPFTRCWRCGRTLRQHPRHKTGRLPYWTAGHLIDSQVDGPLLPEASTCNSGAGASLGGRRLAAKTRRRNTTVTALRM
jgi:hypothetical protein